MAKNPFSEEQNPTKFLGELRRKDRRRKNRRSFGQTSSTLIGKTEDLLRRLFTGWAVLSRKLSGQGNLNYYWKFKLQNSELEIHQLGALFLETFFIPEGIFINGLFKLGTHYPVYCGHFEPLHVKIDPCLTDLCHFENTHYFSILSNLAKNQGAR